MATDKGDIVTTADVECEVLIVGGGPAGSTCAWKLQQQAIDVLLIDKATFPRDKVCAGWITPQVVDLLDMDIDDYRQQNIMQPITGFRVGLVGSSSQQIDYQDVVSFGIRRREFDNYLLKRCGAAVRENTAVSTIERVAGGWRVNKLIRAQMLIGAGGQFCPVRRWLNGEHDGQEPSPFDEQVVAAQEVEFEMSAAEADACAISMTVPELYFYPDLAGYAWCFRKENVLNVGLGRIGERHLKDRREELLNWLISTRRIQHIPEKQFRGHAYRLNSGHPTPRAEDGVILIGDAAGLATVESGEGIRPAIESGLLAAAVLSGARPTYRKDQLMKYQCQIESTSPSLAANGLWSTSRRILGKWLLTQRWFVRRIVLDRWFLNRTAAYHASVGNDLFAALADGQSCKPDTH